MPGPQEPQASRRASEARATRRGSAQCLDAAANADRHLIHVNLDPANDGVFPYSRKTLESSLATVPDADAVKIGRGNAARVFKVA